jgi:penicillin-binding protein 2
MRNLSFFLILVLAAVIVAFTGCAGAPNGEGGAAAPLIQLPQSPEDVVASFLTAWNSRDYPGMYALLSSESQGRTTLPVFQTTYEDVAAAVEIDGVTFRVGEATVQGMTAAVPYNLSLSSPQFGTIEDPDRTMRLVQTPGGWRIAWTSMDIFDGLAAGTRVVAVAQRQPRGNIYDRQGDLLVEQDSIVYEVYAQRLSMTDEGECLFVLAELLRLRRADLAEDLPTYNPETIFYVGDIDPEALDVNGARLNEWCGSSVENGLVQQRTDRRYFGHGAALHVTGYVGQITPEKLNELRPFGYSDGDIVGLAAVEERYERELAGEAARILRITEPGGTIIRELSGRTGSPPQNVTLTIDRDLQLAAAQAFSDAFNYAEPNWASRSAGGSAVVLDVNTGAVLALASYPTFDPGIFSPNTPYPFVGSYITELLNDRRRPFAVRPTQEQYPPGSTFKIVTTAAAAAERLLTPTEIFFCGLEWEGRQFGDSLPVRYDWRVLEAPPRNVPTGEVTMSEALAASCNPFYYQMGAELYGRDPALLMNYARRMGLGTRTGIEDFLPEALGSIVTPRAVDSAINSAIGQDPVQVTPLQMARLVAGVANGGTLYRPYLVQQVGEGEPTQPQAVGQMELSDEALRVVRDGMCQVVSNLEIGTARFVFNNTPEFSPNLPTIPYTACGKTGTAQSGQEAPHSWFVAYAPADNPQIAIAVMVENSREGSEVAAPIVRRILDTYFEVPPEMFATYPEWWTGEYVPLPVSEGVAAA